MVAANIAESLATRSISRPAFRALFIVAARWSLCMGERRRGVSVGPVHAGQRSLRVATAVAVLPSRERGQEVLGFSLQSQVGWIADLINLPERQDRDRSAGRRSARPARTSSARASRARSAIVGVIAISAMIPTATACDRQGRPRCVRRLAPALPAARPRAVAADLRPQRARRAVPVHGVDRRVPAHGVVPVLIALNFAYAVNVATGVASTLSLADGRPGSSHATRLQMAALNLAFTSRLLRSSAWPASSPERSSR